MEHDAQQTIGVIFDMDGVLVDSARPHFASWQQLGREHGVTISEAAFSSTFGRQNRDIIPRFFGEVTADELRRLADRKEEIYRDLVREDPPIVAGAVDLVRALAAGGVLLAVGSSGPRENVELIVSAMGVGDCFHALITADEVTRGKPDPQVFLLAAERIGVAPQRCVVVEDAPSGVQAGLAAGAKVVAVLMHHAADAFAGAHKHIERLSDLESQTCLELARR